RLEHVHERREVHLVEKDVRLSDAAIEHMEVAVRKSRSRSAGHATKGRSRRGQRLRPPVIRHTLDTPPHARTCPRDCPSPGTVPRRDWPSAWAVPYMSGVDAAGLDTVLFTARADRAQLAGSVASRGEGPPCCTRSAQRH